ncbi:30S ribosomal protein S18 [Candidatus Daviesbacteria bacterium]|nr:30S ribosomal protein S18 [Candidatus Daviesbacteria bacterium]
MAEKRKITRKVIAKASTPKIENEQEVLEQPKEGRTKRGCLFCQNSKSPSYTDIATLKRFLTDRSKILPKVRSGICAKHQRAVAKHIKYARHLSLLPFVPKV